MRRPTVKPPAISRRLSLCVQIGARRQRQQQQVNTGTASASSPKLATFSNTTPGKLSHSDTLSLLRTFFPEKQTAQAAVPKQLKARLPHLPGDSMIPTSDMDAFAHAADTSDQLTQQGLGPLRGRRCSHGGRRTECKDCAGGSICTHGRRRRECKDCGGSGICSHGRKRSECKDCGGGSICTHGRVKSKCKDCGRLV